MAYRVFVHNEIAAVFHEPGFLETVIAKRSPHELDAVESPAAALSVSTVYSGIERIMLEMSRDRFGLRPEGMNSHAQLQVCAGSSSWSRT